MLPLFYQKLEPVNTASHKDVSIDTADRFFAAETDVIPVWVSEFAQLQKYYPVVFMAAGDSFIPAAVVGRGENKNLFVSEDGGWDSDYIPAYVRRYPFIVASLSEEAESMSVCIDQSYVGVNREGLGEKLFDDAQQQTDYLKNVSSFLQQCEVDTKRNRFLVDKLQTLELLESAQASFINSETELSAKLDGFFIINRDKLAQLEEAAITDLHRSGALELIYMHLISLQRFSDLFEG